MQTRTKRETVTQKGKNPTGQYQNGHNWQTHTLHCLEIERSTLRCSMCAVHCQRVSNTPRPRANYVAAITMDDWVRRSIGTNSISMLELKHI